MTIFTFDSRHSNGGRTKVILNIIIGTWFIVIQVLVSIVVTVILGRFLSVFLRGGLAFLIVDHIGLTLWTLVPFSGVSVVALVRRLILPNELVCVSACSDEAAFRTWQGTSRIELSRWIISSVLLIARRWWLEIPSLIVILTLIKFDDTLGEFFPNVSLRIELIHEDIDWRRGSRLGNITSKVKS